MPVERSPVPQGESEDIGPVEPVIGLSGGDLPSAPYDCFGINIARATSMDEDKPIPKSSQFTPPTVTPLFTGEEKFHISGAIPRVTRSQCKKAQDCSDLLDSRNMSECASSFPTFRPPYGILSAALTRKENELLRVLDV